MDWEFCNVLNEKKNKNKNINFHLFFEKKKIENFSFESINGKIEIIVKNVNPSKYFGIGILKKILSKFIKLVYY